jgi:lysophospholipid acyltransferase (LPLAT)-like uncharacterized protein
MTDSPNDGELRNTVYQQKTRSQRHMSPLRRALHRLAVPLVFWVVRGYWRICRVVSVVGATHLDTALAKAPALIPCFWHQHQLFCGQYLLQQKNRGLRPAWLISPSMDGEIGAKLVRKLGGEVIRGSSSHTGARALRDYYQALTRDNLSPAITPDGPRGPRFKFKPGAILLAQMSGRPMLPMAYAASSAWLIQWDKFVLPRPGARIAIAIGAPRYVPRVLGAAALQQLQTEMELELRQLFLGARKALDSTVLPS